MITEKELKDTGFKLCETIEDKDSPFDEENTLQVKIWVKKKVDLRIEVSTGSKRGGNGEPFWVAFEQTVDLDINSESQRLKHITTANPLRLLLFALKM